MLFTPVHSVHRAERGLMHHRSHARRSLSRDVSVQGRLCPGGSLSGRPPDRDLPYGNERTVRILLQSILVYQYILTMIPYLLFYRPRRSWAKVIFSQACVCPQGEGGGVCLSACFQNGVHTNPPEQTPPGADTPPQSRHPQSRHPQSRHPLEQTPPGLSTPRPGKQTPAYGQRAAGMHPTGMHSCPHMNIVLFTPRSQNSILTPGADF